jgi:hypothetical protein
MSCDTDDSGATADGQNGRRLRLTAGGGFMRRTTFLSVLIASLVIGLSGLANAGTSDQTNAGAEWLRALFATGRPKDAQAALPLTAPNSAAYAFTVHQIGRLKAVAGSGTGRPQSSVKTKGPKVAVCQNDPYLAYGCVTFTRFKVDKQGRVKSFFHSRGGPAQALVAPVLGTGQSGGAFGVTFKLVSYVQAPDALTVHLEATNAGDGARTVTSYRASYQPPTGPAVQAGESFGLPGDIQPGATATLELQFPGGAEPKGTVTIPMLSGPPDYANGSATVPLG